MKILSITQARIGSTRFPEKVLKKIGKKTLLEIHLNRALQSTLINKLKVATTTEVGVNKIIEICDKLGVETFKGSIENVLERFYLAASPEEPDYVVRLTSDCPLIDPKEIDKVIAKCVADNYDYASNVLEPSLPDGIDVEIFKFSSLEKAYKEATLKSDKEHVTPYIWRNSTVKGGNIFKSLSVTNSKDFSNFRLTVDTIDDYNLIKKLIIKLGEDKGWQYYVNYLEKNPDLISINSKYERNEGLKKSILQD